jgi:hypothetical protein
MFMKHKVTLTITSLLSVLLFSLHWATEIARGMEPGTVAAFPGILILFVWLYATLVLIERRVGVIIVLLGSIMASGVPLIHMLGKGMVGGHFQPSSSGAFFWVWTLVALGASGLISLALSTHVLWRMLRRK